MIKKKSHAIQRLSVSASQRLSVSASQRLSVSASQRLSVSALDCLNITFCQPFLNLSHSALDELDRVSSVLNSSIFIPNTVTVSSQAKTFTNKAHLSQPNAQKLFNEVRPSIEKVTAMITCGTSAHLSYRGEICK